MKQTVYKSDFRDAFVKADRVTQFTYDALGILFDYFESIESEESEIELDVIAICCEYAEMDTDEVIEAYCLEGSVTDMDEDERAEFVRGYLNDETQVCGETESGNFVFAQF